MAAVKTLRLRPTAPGDCEVMVGFNNATGGEQAETLTRLLERSGFKTFCTRLYCTHAGAGKDWRKHTIIGVKTCTVFVPLMTDGWQKSNECIWETDRAITLNAQNKNIIVPVRFASFDAKKDADHKNGGNMFLDKIGESIQAIFADGYDGLGNAGWMDQVVRPSLTMLDLLIVPAWHDMPIISCSATV